MDITLAIGSFFLVLAGIYGFSSGRQRAASPIAARAHARLALVFGLVGLGLVVLHLLR